MHKYNTAVEEQPRLDLALNWAVGVRGSAAALVNDEHEAILNKAGKTSPELRVRENGRTLLVTDELVDDAANNHIDDETNNGTVRNR
jgi:hypothetical protein